jgi:hypothetical protein
MNLDEIEARATAATPGPWKVYEQPIRFHTGTADVEQMIGQAWDHPQMKAPYPVIGVATHIDFDTRKPVSVVRFADNTAEFVAHAREDVPALIARVRELEAERAQWLDAINEGAAAIRQKANTDSSV